jgi:hypothetical protein
VASGIMQVADNIETKNFLDKLRQYPYYDNKGIYDSKLVFDLQAQ